MLILVTGLPGSGKTTLAHALSLAINAKHRNSDVIREKMNYRGRYDRSSKRTVYLRLLSEVEELVAAKNNVIVDATFYKKNLREPFLKLARRQKIPAIWIEVTAEEAVIKKRLAEPRPDSDANFTVYRMLKKQYEPLNQDHLILESDQCTTEELVAKAIEYLTEQGAELSAYH